MLDDVFLAEQQERPSTHDRAELPANKDFRKMMSGALDHANARLSTIEKVRKYIIAPEPFATENDMMTPTLKIRRHVISTYGGDLEKLYDR